MAGKLSERRLQADEAIARADGARAPVKAFDWAYLNNPTTHLGLLLAFCGGAPVWHFWGWAWALAFVVSTSAGLILLMTYAIRGERGDTRAADIGGKVLVGLVGVWMLDATALFTTGDRAAWAFAFAISFSWSIHIIFTTQPSTLITKICMALCTAPMVWFLIYAAWASLEWWLAILTSISACTMWMSIAASAKWSRQNIAARDRAIKSTQAMTERLKFAVEAAGDGYFELDLKTGVYRPNLAMAQSMGITSETPSVDDVRERVHPDDLPGEIERIERALRGELTSWDQDLRIMDHNNEYRWMHMRVRLLEHNGERVLLGTLTDLRERKAMEEELRAAKERAEASSRAKSEFLANMSHEIRTPLNGVLGMAQSLETEDLTEAQRKQVAIILDSGKSLTSLLNDVLDLSKIEAGKLEIAPVPGDLLHTVKRVRQLFQTTAEEKGLQLSARFSADFPQRLVYDPVRVRQCVSNLISNAVKFTQSGRIDVAISAQDTGGGEYLVKIDVIDTGIGMTEDVQDKLFAAFTQADGAITRRFGGTGLGLAISRHLARMMGGDIGVMSKPGEGSTFTLTFKAKLAEAAPAGATSQAAAAPNPVASGMRGKRVLLTDDNAVNRQVIKLFMAPLACEVVEATNGKEALDVLATETIHIVLLDVHMPVMDGTEAIKRIRAANAPWKDIPVIALTADAMSGDREKYLAMGMTDYVSKPVDQRELSTKMLQAINGLAPGEADRKAG